MAGTYRKAGENIGKTKLLSYVAYLKENKISPVFVHAFERPTAFPNEKRDEFRSSMLSLHAEFDTEKKLYIVKGLSSRNYLINMAKASILTIISFDAKIDSLAITTGRCNSSGVSYPKWVVDDFSKFIWQASGFVLFGTQGVYAAKDSMEKILVKLGMKKEVKIDEKYVLKD
ncbi:Uncharacterised protein [uncultured archaeon]|nr:Uncharacterised protein [uncultured archaeon]